MFYSLRLFVPVDLHTIRPAPSQADTAIQNKSPDVVSDFTLLTEQILALIISIFGFNGYAPPADDYNVGNCQFCTYSSGGTVCHPHCSQNFCWLSLSVCDA